MMTGKNMTKTVTIFPNTTSPGNPNIVKVSQVVQGIKTGGKIKELIEQIRSISVKKDRDVIKKKLPCICFSGQFSYRKDDALIKHSGLVAIDFDHLNERLMEFRNRIIKDKYTHIAFISPSGDGLKIVVKIPDSVSTHKMSCDALSDYYKEETLDEFKDVSRICYASYDPDIYFNPGSEIFTTLKEEKVIKRSIETIDLITDFDTIIDNLVTWLANKGEHYSDGNKHKYLVKLAAACNRFGVPETVACQKAIFRFISTASAVDPKDYADLFKRVYRNYGHLSCTAHFDHKGTAYETTTKTVLTEAIFDISLPLKDVIYLDNVRDSMLQTFHTGRARGESTGFKTIDPIYRLKRRHLELFHGIGNHGKSAVLMQICLLLSVLRGYKWAVFSPEQDPPDDFYDDLVQSYIGKNTQPYFSDQMTEQEYIQGMDFIKDHFFYIFPDDEAPNQEYINRRFEEIILKHKVDGCIIDPYNQLDNDIVKFGGREDQYLSKFLTIQKKFAQTHDIFMFIVTHPKGAITKNNQGDYNCPDVFDLAGGAMWNNKCDDIICIYRPFASSNKKDTTVKFISQKIKKRKLCGSPGEVILDYEVQTGRYMENVNGMQSSPFNPGFEKRPEITYQQNFYEKEEVVYDENNMPF
jgi:twinkle protein